MLYGFLAYKDEQAENDRLEYFLRQESRQYEITRHSIDLINMKAHDLKHHLAQMRAGGGYGQLPLPRSLKRRAALHHQGRYRLPRLRHKEHPLRGAEIRRHHADRAGERDVFIERTAALPARTAKGTMSPSAPKEDKNERSLHTVSQDLPQAPRKTFARRLFLPKARAFLPFSPQTRKSAL